MPNLDVRPEVAAFALLMEERLRANDHKPGWKKDGAWALYRRVQDEAAELEVALRRLGRPNMRQGVAKEAADVANFAMMVCDVVGALNYDGRK